MNEWLNNRRILVVDDVVANRVLLRRYLQGKGFGVDEAASGKEALELCRHQDYDLVLMDIMMGDMDGRDATSAIKEVKEGDQVHMPIIYVTALSSQEAYLAAMAAGGDDFLTKPINFPVLEAKLNAHLRVRYLYQQLEQKNEDLNQLNQYLNHERDVVSHLLKGAYQRNRKAPCCVREYLSPVSGFNGDILLSDMGPGGNYYLMLGDFTGHGLVAAIGTFPVKQAFFRLAEQGVPLIDMVREINRELRDFLPPDIFCAAILLQLDAYGRRILFWGGSMPPAYMVAKDGSRLQVLNSRHMALGVLDDDEFDPALDLVEIDPNASLYLHTDGLTETTDAAGEEFGEARLQAVLREAGDGSRIQGVMESVAAFRGEGEQQDDIALVEIDLQHVDDLTRFAQGERPGQAPVSAGLTPFRCQLAWGAEEIRRQDPVTLCVGILAQQPGLQPHMDMIHTLFAELYNNALEHSVLGLPQVDKSDTLAFLNYYRQRQQGLEALEDARIQLDMGLMRDERGDALEILLEDNGRGFDAEHYLALSRDTGQLGRGLMLLQQFSEVLEYSDGGRRARLRYRLDQPA